MAIPDKLFDALSMLNLSSYEYRILMVILARTYGNGKKSCSLKLAYFVEKTKIKKPHACHALSALEERNVLDVISIGNIKSYSLQDDFSKWRSDLSIKLIGKEIEKYNKDFNKWFKHYPIQVYEEDARIVYLNLISNGEKPSVLWDALMGYIKFNLARCRELNKDPQPLTCRYPTNFLKNGVYKEFLKYTSLKVGPKL